jgi:esterase
MLYSRIEGQGKPLLIIHGYLGMSDNWKTLGGQYAANGYQVHALDLRNHGKSFHSDVFNYTVMVQDVLDYCLGHQLDKVNIIGHSMGGKVAMFFAVQYPDKVNKLVVADIGPKYYAPHHQVIFLNLAHGSF